MGVGWFGSSVERGYAKGVAQMAWESRGNGMFYYRKHRVGQRVFSVYVGTGPVAQMIAAADQTEREERQQSRDRARHEREREAAALAPLIDAQKALTGLVRASLIAHGYHTHKGQWRRRRG